MEENVKNKIDSKKLLLVAAPALVLIVVICSILIWGKGNNPTICEDDRKYFADPAKFPKINEDEVVNLHDYYLLPEQMRLDESLLNNPEVFYDKNGEQITQGAAIRDAYAAKHALSKIDKSFAKLPYNQMFDGNIACVYSPNSSTYLVEEGVTIDMKRKLQTYENIVFDYGFSSGSFNMEVTVSFYKNISSSNKKEFEKFSFHFTNIISSTHGGSASMISFYPQEIMESDISLAGCSIMSYQFTSSTELLTYSEVSHLDDLLGVKFLKMYEWQLPNSTWKK